MSARRPAAMVLPPHERSSGDVEYCAAPSYVHDARVPMPLRRDYGDGYTERVDPQVAGHSPYVDDACPDGRHLFDVIESSIEHEVGEPHTDDFVGYEYQFRARLTCVRCGRISEWEGRRTERTIGRVPVAPMVSGDLVAQQVSVADSWARDDRPMSTWLVYRGGARVGVLQWARGQRGRAFHVARFDAWPPGEHVEGKNPESALRKLARAAVPPSSAREVAVAGESSS